MELEKLSGLELGALVNSKEVSAVEVIQYFSERIQSRNSRINAFTYTKIEDALKEAIQIDNKIACGEDAGCFAGVPVGLKDFLPSKKGWTNSHGGVPHLVRVDDSDSMFYTAARELGAIAVGKTNAPAFGFSGACQNVMYGDTRNPFNISYSSGGSSGGSAAAVADGLILLGEGGDAGGSIRIPAGWCNLFGFKPSLGTVPSYCRPDGWSATHPYCFNGAITKTVADSAAMLNNMARYNPRDPISLPINASKNFLELMKKSIKDMKIGFTFDFNLYPVDAEIKDVIRKTIELLESECKIVEPISFNFKHSLDEILECWGQWISIDTALDLEHWKHEGLDLVKDHPYELPKEFIIYNDRAAKMNIFDFRKFNEIRTDILDNIEDAFENYDILLSPVSVCNPPKISDNGHVKEVNGVQFSPDIDFIGFGETPLFNFIGYPAASVPAGLSASGLPVGLQVIGKQYKDEDVFAISNALEQLNPWRHRFDGI